MSSDQEMSSDAEGSLGAPDTSEAEVETKSEAEVETKEFTDERERIRKELSTISFEELHKLKAKIGAKLYNDAVFGKEARAPKTTSFKRANKNRPCEASSKIRPKVAMPKVKVPRKPRHRDPRFDPMCGEFDGTSFQDNYRFLGDVRKNERGLLAKELQETTDPERKRTIQLLMQRIDNKIREQDKRDKEDQRKKAERMEIREKRMRGEKPIFKKKSERKVEDLINKYEELKSTNRLQKHIEKRSKKLATKDRKRMETNFMDAN